MMGHKVGRPHDETIKVAKAAAAKATRQAAALNADESVNRSTRLRAAYKLKAEALDHVLLVLKDEA
jgi:hypothetical protein